MLKSDTKLIAAADILLAVGLLSRIPVPIQEKSSQTRAAASAWAFPLVGCIVAILVSLIAWAALQTSAAHGLIATLILLAQIMLTGALHEDGLADTADGFWGGWDASRRLEIMKDSHIGTYGVIALILSLLARWVAISAILATGYIFPALIAAAALSRAPMVAMMVWMPSARSDGLSASLGAPKPATALLAIGLALLIAIGLTGTTGLIAAVLIGSLSLLFAFIALKKIGGQTGDILGASQQIAEICALAVFTMLLT